MLCTLLSTVLINASQVHMRFPIYLRKILGVSPTVPTVCVALHVLPLYTHSIFTYSLVILRWLPTQNESTLPGTVDLTTFYRARQPREAVPYSTVLFIRIDRDRQKTTTQ